MPSYPITSRPILTYQSPKSQISIMTHLKELNSFTMRSSRDLALWKLLQYMPRKPWVMSCYGYTISFSEDIVRLKNVLLQSRNIFPQLNFHLFECASSRIACGTPGKESHVWLKQHSWVVNTA